MKIQKTFKTKMAEETFRFKQKYYLAALVARDFNANAVSKALGASRRDVITHVGVKWQAKQLARELELI